LDKIIKPGSGAIGNHLRPHTFLPIDETVSKPGYALADAAREGFKRGLVRQENRCPTLSGMDAILSNRISAGQQDADVSGGLKSEGQDPVEEPLAVACLLERFSEAIKRLEEQRDAIYERAAEETVKLALVISEKVINHEVSVNPDRILSIVRAAVQKIKAGQSIRIRVNPDDFKVLKQADTDMSYLKTAFEGFAFQADAAMARGDCLVETRQGNIDASIRNQLAVIEEAFASLGHLSQNAGDFEGKPNSF
jgi:flagellar biosynthesis/type III secretory pathway protein FliH